MKNLPKKLAMACVFMFSLSLMNAQQIKPIKKIASPSTESINCVKCPIKRDNNTHIQDRVLQTKKSDSLKAGTETINCVKCPIRKDNNNHVLDRVVNPKQKDSLHAVKKAG